MIEQLLRLLPPERVEGVVFACVLLGAVVGTATLLLGGLRSRAAMTLIMMCLGLAFGRALPGWRGWSTEPNATAMLGAVLGAVLGFILHRLWIALGIGCLAAIVAAVVVWFQAEGPRYFEAPPMEQGVTVWAYGHTLWQQAPQAFRDNLLLACAPVVGVFALLGFIFRRVGIALFYALAGSMLLAVSLLIGEASGRMPGLKNLLPKLIELRVLLFAAVVLLGTLVQLSLIRTAGRATPSPLPADDS